MPHPRYGSCMQAFIFDFDGVIVDSERYWKTLGDDEFFASLVPTWTRENGARMMGLGVRDAYDVLTREFGVTVAFEEYEKRLNACVSRIYEELCSPLPGLTGLLDRLGAAGTPVGVASSSQSHWIAAALARLGLTDRFPVIVTAADVGHRAKPAPDVYLRAAALLGADPAACIALEDSKNGVLSAKAAGMACIAVHTDMNVDQLLQDADAHVTHYDDITDTLLSSLASAAAD